MRVDQVVSIIRGQPNTPVRLTLQRPGKPDPIEVRIVRQLVELEVVEDVSLKEGNVGYMRLTNFNQRSDVKVDLTEQDWIAKRDPQLEKALEILHRKIGYVKPAAAPGAANPAPAGSSLSQRPSPA